MGGRLFYWRCGVVRRQLALDSQFAAAFSVRVPKWSFIESLNKAVSEGVPFALGIITRTTGSSPQRQGAKAIFFTDGRIYGTLGGGCLEAEVQDRARRALASGNPEEFHLVLDHDFGWDDGLICGGAVHGLILPQAAQATEVWRTLMRNEQGWGVREDFQIALGNENDGPWKYRESADRPFSLWIAGSGHVAHALAPLAVNLGFQVTVFDDRPALATRERFPDTALRVGDWPHILRDPMPPQSCFGVVMTRGHQHDALVLREWIRKPFAFLAMLGSRRKRRVIFSGLIAERYATEEELSHVACPAGLDIGAVSVDEIALSIAAQLVERRSRIRIASSP